MLQAAQSAFMSELFSEALKFGGAVMIRRIVGIAHIDDFKDIPDIDARYSPLDAPFPQMLSSVCSPPPSSLSEHEM